MCCVRVCVSPAVAVAAVAAAIVVVAVLFQIFGHTVSFFLFSILKKICYHGLAMHICCVYVSIQSSLSTAAGHS